jgi:hypothetical protein
MVHPSGYRRTSGDCIEPRAASRGAIKRELWRRPATEPLNAISRRKVTLVAAILKDRTGQRHALRRGLTTPVASSHG